ncbi:DNA topoisomerase type IIA protein [Dioscorea alata]|uniref:DNA topoisomerase type IIA protein n=1 Tax=Dioscorea alata TaxID=55571 RepID=A0ACB7UFI5_DIOAL|nr:DNA topoisomerase type IIA protein [Dioscorea alata]
MTIEKKLPLQSSSAHNAAAAGDGAAAGKKTIEETYQKVTQLEHILLRPDTYIGSIEKHTQDLWVFEKPKITVDAAEDLAAPSGDDKETMVHRKVTFVPGLYKIFDEILVNAADNKQRDPSMDCLRVEIDPQANRISIYNNGDGVPIEIHADEGVYVPEMIFGHLLTSSNYNDNVKKTTGGRNGYGAKLTNIFSTEFVIETADGKRQKKYKQVFSDNMSKKSEPNITKCKNGENWTKVTFKPDLAKFNMTMLEDDVVALMKRRVVDLAGTLGKTVKVELNGKRVPVKSFADYVNLYLQSASKFRAEPLPRMMERVNERWEVCVSLSDGHFQQVSFVNGIATTKGGSHVDYVTNQITGYVINSAKKKNKNVTLKAQYVKNHLWVFVNALIDNPAFDSQTKENLTTRQGSFGSKCELSEEFLKKVAKSGVLDNVLSWADMKQSKELKKTDGTKKQRITGIPKLEDANEAGSSSSHKCTLVLTEGDSAKALAMAGISVVGRNHYGVFPLRGKLLNVREASHKQIMENQEIQSLKQALGLQHGKQYESVNGLRYGHLMIMTDQDHDGSHIKGLLINFIHSFWPSLLKIPSFMLEFITPIVKATHRNGRVLAFYTMPEYEAWKMSIEGNANGWTIKYYKGLGTSTSKEGKEYFSDLGKHQKDFLWVDEQDGDAIELAFSKKKIEARKNWLRQFEPGTYLDQTAKLIKYSDFVNKELILFSMADLQRSIPSMVDGLKPGQRKILYCSFKRPLIKELKVAQFSGYVSEKSAYHHGEQSLASTIIGMAQDFVGSNNINLLQPNGQFGTRHQGGKDHASARYIFTCLSPVTRFLFPKDDDALLNYLSEDGQTIEPTWYMPIIPMVLINGSEGIGTGWSSYIPNYNPRDIVANVKRLLNGEEMQPMDPWYRGFKGRIEKSASKVAGVTYTITGIAEEIDNNTLRILELPIRRWTQDYKEFLESLMTGNEKSKEPFIQDYREHNDDTTVHFEVILSEENMNIARQEGLEKKFKLTTTISTSNMHLFDPSGVIKKYDTPEQILEEFFSLRLEFYEKRKKKLLDSLEFELMKLDNRVRFILGVVRNEIIVSNRKKADLLIELREKGFTPIRKENKGIEAAVAGAMVDSEENEESSEDSPEIVRGGVRASDYDYLLSMAIGTLTLEKVQELIANKNKLEADVEELKCATVMSLWSTDLEAFEGMLDEQDKLDAEAEQVKNEMRKKGLNSKAAAASKNGPKRPRKTNTAKPPPPVVPVTAQTDANNAAEAVKPKPRGGGKKATSKKTVDNESDEDDEILALRDRLRAQSLSSSAHENVMDVEEVPAKKEPSKRAAAAKASSSIAITDISDEDDEPLEDYMPNIPEDDNEDGDEEFEVIEIPKGKKTGRRKADTTTTTTARKRGAAINNNKQKQPVLSQQKLITEVLKPVEQQAKSSPEKKVRKIRASPFNKKSGSVLGKSSLGNSEDSSSSLVSGSSPSDEPIMIARPRRGNRTVKKATYVESDSEMEQKDDDDDDPVTDDSDFEEDDF